MRSGSPALNASTKAVTTCLGRMGMGVLVRGAYGSEGWLGRRRLATRKARAGRQAQAEMLGKQHKQLGIVLGRDLLLAVGPPDLEGAVLEDQPLLPPCQLRGQRLHEARARMGRGEVVRDRVVDRVLAVLREDVEIDPALAEIALQHELPVL